MLCIVLLHAVMGSIDAVLFICVNGLLCMHHVTSARAFALTRWTRKGLEHEDDSHPAWEDNESEEDVGEESVLPTEPITQEQLRAAADTWQRCSVLVGMHPDQARPYCRNDTTHA